MPEPVVSSPKVVAPIQARMASSRLPGKVLMPLAGRPLLEVLYRRIASATHVDEIWFATGIDMENDPIEALGHSLGVPVYRGSDEDVLQRLVDACECADADIVVDITGDNPFVDGGLLDAAVEVFLETNDQRAYLNSDLKRGHPLGYKCQVYTVASMRAALATTDAGSPYRTHPNLYFYKNPDRFPHVDLPVPPALNRPDLRLTVDYAEDYELARCVFDALGGAGLLFPLKRVIEFLDAHPEVARLNSDCIQFSPEV